MSLVKKLIPIALFSLLMGCQTQKSVELNNPSKVVSKSTNSSQINNIPQEKSTSSEIFHSIYAINNYIGYYYEDGKTKLVSFSKTILDEYIDGDYKVIKAR